MVDTPTTEKVVGDTSGATDTSGTSVVPVEAPIPALAAAQEPIAAALNAIARTPMAQAVSGRFAKAVEDAKAGASQLREEAAERTGAARDNIAATASEWSDEAAILAARAKEKGGEIATLGKSRASDALSALGRVISDNAPVIDDKLGVEYGDHARTAARSIQEAAASLESKDFGELGQDAIRFVRERPVTALGIAAVTGFLVARLIGGKSDKASDTTEA